MRVYPFTSLPDCQVRKTPSMTFSAKCWTPQPQRTQCPLQFVWAQFWPSASLGRAPEDWGWACRRAQEIGVLFAGTPEQIDAMIQDRAPVQGDLFLDYVVSGNVFSRPGLNALIKRALEDPEVSHIFIPRRDRLARPDDPIDAMKLENLLRE